MLNDKDIFLPQGSAFQLGICSFEPYIYRIHKDFNDGVFVDWPTVFLATTLQSTAVSLFKLLPPPAISHDILDKRSIASLVRNIVDTYDVMNMMSCFDDTDRFELNRNILGMYLSGRINVIQKSINCTQVESFYLHSRSFYWNKIKKSPLYVPKMDRLKNGEGIFYQSRKERLVAACGDQADIVSGILTDISTYVHSIPPALWLSDLDDLYTDSISNRNSVAIWLGIANFYFAKTLSVFFNSTEYEKNEDILKYINHHKILLSE